MNIILNNFYNRIQNDTQILLRDIRRKKHRAIKKDNLFIIGFLLFISGTIAQILSEFF